MRSNRNGNLQGFRAPSDSEKASEAKYMVAYFKSIVRICRIVCSIFFPLGLLLLAASIANLNQPVWDVFFLLLSSLLFLSFATLAVLDIRVFQQVIQAFQNGEFQVLTGKISRIEPSFDRSRFKYVGFRSLNNELAEGTYEVRDEKLSLLTPLLMVRIQDRHKNRTWVFTPFMLSDNTRRNKGG